MTTTLQPQDTPPSRTIPDRANADGARRGRDDRGAAAVRRRRRHLSPAGGRQRRGVLDSLGNDPF